MEILKPFIDAPEGVALVADNKKFLSRIYRDGRQRIEAAKDVKDPYTRFLVTKTADGKRVCLQADNGSYCSLIQRGDVYYMEAAKQILDEWCEFQPFTVDRQLVLKGHNGLFISRIYRDDIHSIEAAKAGVDPFCKFTPGVGDIIPPKLEILDVTWDSSGQSVIYNPTVVSEDTYINNASNEIVQEFELKWSNKTTETTTWSHAWGFEFSFTYRSSLIESVVAKYEFQAKVSYNGSYGTSSTDENEASFQRKLTVTAAAHKKTTVKMVVKKADNVSLPFTAKIRRTNADGTQRIIYEQGTWTGVGYQSAYVEVQENELEMV
jgi:hypothetical protein